MHQISSRVKITKSIGQKAQNLQTHQRQAQIFSLHQHNQHKNSNRNTNKPRSKTNPETYNQNNPRNQQINPQKT